MLQTPATQAVDAANAAGGGSGGGGGNGSGGGSGDGGGVNNGGNPGQKLTDEFSFAKKLHSPHFLASSSGYTTPVPTNAIGPYATRAPGVMFKGGAGGHGFDIRTTDVRVMDANWNQGNRTLYENIRKQILDPFSGDPDHHGGHFYHKK